jgi:DNA-binding NtrC family response regulator
MTVSLLRTELGAEDAPLPGMVGEHPLMKEVYRLVRRVAPTNLQVLIVGETGTGKELVARAVHELSERTRGPFVAVNAAAIPESLFESELFGHERGAFSDARAEKPGLLEVAHRGTFFCDELPALAASCQAKLLRVIEDGCARRVGGLRDRPAAPRWITACQSTTGLRADLRHRLAGAVVHVPPLRERVDDVLPLANHFLGLLDHGTLRLSPEAAGFLVSHSWSGNVRELRQVIARAAVMARCGQIEAADVAYALADHQPTSLAHQGEVEDALRKEAWNVRNAARQLGVSRATMNRWIRALGLRRPSRVSHVSWRQSQDT